MKKGRCAGVERGGGVREWEEREVERVREED